MCQRPVAPTSYGMEAMFGDEIADEDAVNAADEEQAGDADQVKKTLH